MSTGAAHDNGREIVVTPLLLTIDQAADLCQVGYDRMREWTFAPGFPVIREAHQVRIHARLLDEWLARRAQAGQEVAA